MSPSIVCPECGQSLDPRVDDVLAHALTHWPYRLNEVASIPNEEAQRRYMVLANFAETNAMQPVAVKAAAMAARKNPKNEGA